MPLNRRDFFGQFWGADGRRPNERRARAESLETYAWMNLLPYDFALNETQYKDLDRELKAYVSSLSDGTLFSMDATRGLADFMSTLVEPWRQEYLSTRSE